MARDSGASQPREEAVRSASFPRRMLSLAYEALLLVGVLWAAALPLGFIDAAADAAYRRHFLQICLFSVAGAYFVWQWTRGGQTLAMKTWRLRLVDRGGGEVRLQQAVARYVAAVASVACVGVGFVWALIDREGDFLHDRLARTRVTHVSGG